MTAIVLNCGPWGCPSLIPFANYPSSFWYRLDVPRTGRDGIPSNCFSCLVFASFIFCILICLSFSGDCWGIKDGSFPILWETSSSPVVPWLSFYFNYYLRYVLTYESWLFSVYSDRLLFDWLRVWMGALWMDIEISKISILL